jgi:hypothetical protein
MSLTRMQRIAWVTAACGLMLCAVGWRSSPTIFASAWLSAMTLSLSWSLGSMALLYIHALTGGRWGHAIRRPLAAGAASLPWLLPTFIPVASLAPVLYPWVRGSAHHFYLNLPFFCIRAVVYVAAWSGLSFLTGRALRGRDRDQRLARFAPAALIVLGITVTFAATDLTLSLQPQFTSSIYGWLVACQSLLLAFSVAVLAGSGTHHARRPDLAKLLLAMVVLWAYLDFMQLLIVWNSNLPNDALWYGPRLNGLWGILAGIIAVLHFALPFFVLIFPRMQQSSRAVALIAVILIGAEILRAWWIVIPAAHRGLGWIDLAAMLAVVPLAAAFGFRAFMRSTDLETFAHV